MADDWGDASSESTAPGWGGRPTDGDRGTAFEETAEYSHISPSEAFSKLANETRIEILQALWDHGDDRVAFSDLHEAVGGDRGNFNYHLSELAGHFVRSTEDGYELREAGEAVIRAVLAGVITSDPSIEPTDLGLPCPLCGGSIEFEYADEWITVRCSSCTGVLGGDVPRGTFMHHPFPPAGLQGRDGVEVLESARVYYETALLSMLQGVCPECGGYVDRDLHVCDDHDVDEEGLCTVCASVPGVWVDLVCENCVYRRWSVLWLVVLFHPAVVRFVHERRPFDDLLDLRRLLWLHSDTIGGIEQTLRSTDPLRVAVTVPFDGDEIVVTVDGQLNAVDVS